MRTLLLLTLCVITSPTLADWPQFRGPGSTGGSESADPPIEWSATKNVAWKADLPGVGFSQPVVAGGNVYVTGTSGVRDDRLHVVCYDAATGKQRWQRQFWATGRTAVHTEMRVATPTPVAADGKVWAFYSSNNVACLDRDGNLLWYRGLGSDYPNASNSLGMASSPVLADGTLLVQMESDDASLAIGLDAATGINRWKQDRPRKANWSSPFVMPAAKGDRSLFGLQAAAGITVVDSATGETVWEFDGGGSTVASATPNNDLVLIPANGVTAVRQPTGTSNPEVVWESRKLNCSYVSPVAYRNRVYTINSSGVLSCGDLATGDILWQLRLGGSYWGTPAAAAGRLYCPAKDGVVRVVDVTAEEGKLLSENDIGQPLYSPPALDGKAVYLRTDTTLWKIAAP